MRISVCEFLRLKTNTNWFYQSPGHWMADGGVMEAFRDTPDNYKIYRGGRYSRTLEYFEGLPSNEVRRLNQES